MKVAVLFDNLGPYHLARLRAAERRLEVLAVEVYGRSTEYAWSSSRTTEPFRRVTLFSGDDEDEHRTRIGTRLREALATFQPDAFAIPGWSSPAAFAALRWCLDQKVPAIAMADSTAHDEPRRAWKEWVKRAYLRLCSAALAAGRLHREYLEQLGVPKARIFLGYDVVDNQHFHRPDSNASAPREIFLASARFVEKKNLFRLLDAYARYRQLAATSHPWQLVLLGDGPLREAVEAHVRSCQLQAHVEMPGFVQYPDLPQHFHRAGAFVHASTTEQWGLVVNEAMASSLPVLVSNRCGCAPDLVQEGVNGWTFDPTDVEQLADLMGKVSAPGFPLQEFGAASHRMIADWGPDRFAAGLCEVVECAAQIGPKRGSMVDRLVLEGLLRK